MSISGDTSFYYITCPLGSRGDHLNVKCFGDSTGMLKRVAHSGSPPYLYEWFKDGILYSSGFNDTLFGIQAQVSYVYMRICFYAYAYMLICLYA